MSDFFIWKQAASVFQSCSFPSILNWPSKLIIKCKINAQNLYYKTGLGRGKKENDMKKRGTQHKKIKIKYSAAGQTIHPVQICICWTKPQKDEAKLIDVSKERDPPADEKWDVNTQSNHKRNETNTRQFCNG